MPAVEISSVHFWCIPNRRTQYKVQIYFYKAQITTRRRNRAIRSFAVEQIVERQTKPNQTELYQNMKFSRYVFQFRKRIMHVFLHRLVDFYNFLSIDIHRWKYSIFHINIHTQSARSAFQYFDIFKGFPAKGSTLHLSKVKGGYGGVFFMKSAFWVKSGHFVLAGPP